MTGTAPADRTGANTGRVAVGLILAGIGAILLLDRTGYIDFVITIHLWPVILILIGVAKTIAEPRRPAFWLLFIGGWGLISEYRLFGLGYSTSWPLLVIAAGVSIIWGAIVRSDGARAGRGEQS